MKMLFFLMLNNTWFFLNMKSPFTMTILVITQTLIMTLILGFSSKSYWYSYIFFLIFVGGMMILFMYLMAFIYNKKIIMYMDIKKFLLYNAMLIFMIFSLNTLIMYTNYDIMNLFMYYLNNFDNGLNKLYNTPNNVFSLLLMSYLFYILIVVVWLTIYNMGSLRTA